MQTYPSIAPPYFTNRITYHDAVKSTSTTFVLDSSMISFHCVISSINRTIVKSNYSICFSYSFKGWQASFLVLIVRQSMSGHRKRVQNLAACFWLWVYCSDPVSGLDSPCRVIDGNGIGIRNLAPGGRCRIQNCSTNFGLN